ncbi:hypothetical protein ACFW04_001827 [Cataglyphis niger]
MSSIFMDYDYDFDDYARSFNNNTTILTVHLHWNSLLRLILTILLRVGFVLVQVGSVPINNINLILLQNVVDLSCVTVMYFLTGFLIAYNGDMAGLIGEGSWIGDPTVDRNEAIIGWQAVVIASAIYTSAIVGRMHTAGYLLVNILLSGLIQPLLIHWAWTAEGWMANNKLGGRIVSFKDYAGAGVVHIVGGFSGLIGCVVLGRRILILRDLDDASITAGSAGTVFGGLLLIFAGLQGLCMNTYERDKFRIYMRDPSYAYINNLLAASSCTLFVVGLHFIFSRETFNYWTVMRCVQGTIVGVVIVSAATTEYSPQIAIALGCLGGIAFYLISRQVFSSALEDYCNIIAIHLVCAILGSILAPLCAARADEDIVTILWNFSWQLICLAALLALVGTTMSLIFGMLECCSILRNRSEILNHTRANAAIDRGPARSFLQRLFFPDSGCLYLQPSLMFATKDRSNVGSRSWKYQTEIDKLEERRPTGSKPNVNKIEDNVMKVQVPEPRVKKARQVHTLPGCTPVLIEDQGGTGESINNDLSEIGRGQFLGKEIKYILDPIEEIDEEISKEFEIKESNAQHKIEEHNVSDKSSILTKNFNTKTTEQRDLNESNYQLRRTVKLMNLYHEFVKEDVKVVLGPKRMDSSSSDSCDEDTIFEKTSDLNEGYCNNDSLIYSIK